MHFNPQSNIMPGGHDSGGSSHFVATEEKPCHAKGGLQAGVVLFACGVGITIGAWIWRENGGPQKAHAAFLSALDDQRAEDATDAGNSSVTMPLDSDASPAFHADALPEGLLDDEKTPAERQARSRQLYRSARSHMAYGRHTDALPYLTEAIDLDPDFAHARYQLGLAHAMIGSMDASRAEYDKLRMMDPSLANLLHNIIRAQDG